MQLSWVTNIQQQCLNADVAFFFKQWWAFRRKEWLVLEGRTWVEMRFGRVRDEATLVSEDTGRFILFP
jgi:protein gp37